MVNHHKNQHQNKQSKPAKEKQQNAKGKHMTQIIAENLAQPQMRRSSRNTTGIENSKKHNNNVTQKTLHQILSKKKKN